MKDLHGSLLSAYFSDCVDKLIELNKTDILLAKKRFTSMVPKTSHVPLSSRDSFKALSTEEQKVRKAKQFGVQLMPGLGQTAVAPPTRMRLNSGKQS